MRKWLLILFVSYFVARCRDESLQLSTNSNDLFYLEEEGAKMPVLVQGNTASKIFIVMLHGGPGGEALNVYNGVITDTLKTEYAVVYWDQRASGSTQGYKGKRLSIESFVEDTEKLLSLLRYLYGSDIRFVIYSHSWGGVIAPAFLSKPQNQTDIIGWINVDGLHNWRMNDEETWKMLDTVGKYLISMNNSHKEFWEKVVKYTGSVDPPFTLLESGELNRYAHEAEENCDSVIRGVSPPSRTYQPGVAPMSILMNGISMGINQRLYNELLNMDLSDRLPAIKVPMILCWGRYDFVIPLNVARDQYSKIGSRYREFWIFNYSGHSPMFNQNRIFNKKVMEFLARVK